MTDVVDYRPRIPLSQAGGSACFLLCDYKGRQRQFLYMDGDTKLLGHVTSCKDVGNETLELRMSNVHDNWKTYLVPAWITSHMITSGELTRYNGGKEVWLNSTS